jgi:hypothetical protein
MSLLGRMRMRMMVNGKDAGTVVGARELERWKVIRGSLRAERIRDGNLSFRWPVY